MPFCYTTSNVNCLILINIQFEVKDQFIHTVLQPFDECDYKHSNND